jgi:hypothetical protein
MSDDFERACWCIGADTQAELVLAGLPCDDPQRAGLTEFLRRLRDDALVATEYDAWRRQWPGLTALMTDAGRYAGRRAAERWLAQSALDGGER